MEDIKTGFAVTADTSPFEAAMGRVKSAARDGQGGVQGAFSSLGRVAAGAFAAFASFEGMRAFARIADEAQLAQARIQQASGSIEAGVAAQQQLYALSQRMGAPLAEVQGSYARIGATVRDMGGGVRESVALTEILVGTAKAAGASAQEAAASATQFAQALGSGKLQGDELKSILENNQVLSRSLAQALGVTVDELRKMGEEGKLTSDVVGNALLGAADQIRASYGDLPVTVGSAFTMLTNSGGKLISTIDQMTGVTGVAAETFRSISQVLDLFIGTLGDTSNASSVLGANTGAKDFAQGVANVFGRIIDYGRAVVETFNGVGRAVGAVAAAVGQAASGSLTGAAAALKGGIEDIEATNQKIAGLIDGTVANSIQARIRASLMGPKAPTGGAPFQALRVTAPAGGAGGGGRGGAKKAGSGRAAAEKSDMPTFDAGLSTLRAAAAEMDALRGLTKAEELKYWEDILANHRIKSIDKVGITRKIEAARVAVLQESAQREQQLASIGIAAEQARGLAGIDAEQQAAQLRTNLDQQTKEQLLQQELAFEERRQVIRMKALRDSLANLNPAQDVVKIAELHAQIEQLEQAHQLRMGQIRGQIATESANQQNAIWTDLSQRMGGLWDKGVQAMMQGQLTARGAMKAIGAELLGWTSGIVKKIVMEWVEGEMLKLAAAQTGVAGRVAAEQTGAAASTAMSAGAAGTNIMNYAWEAMAGAWKAMVGIPYIGPFLAVGAAAAAFAGVASLVGNLSSAAGGYDIPSGVNPLTQLHAEEMVLPAKYADVIRGMAVGGSGAGAGGGAGGGGVVINVSTPNADSFRKSRRQIENAVRWAQG